MLALLSESARENVTSVSTRVIYLMSEHTQPLSVCLCIHICTHACIHICMWIYIHTKLTGVGAGVGAKVGPGVGSSVGAFREKNISVSSTLDVEQVRVKRRCEINVCIQNSFMYMHVYVSIYLCKCMHYV